MIKLERLEGASQRVQEDTIKFTRIMEGLGTSFIESVMVLIQFVPILLGLSIGIPIFLFWRLAIRFNYRSTNLDNWVELVFLIGLGWLLKISWC